MSVSRSRSRPPRPEEEALYSTYAARPRTMPELLQWRADRDADRIAITAQDGRMTFADWRDRAASAAQALVDAGVEPDDRVALWGSNENGCAWVASMLAIQYAGAIPVPVTSGAPLVASEDRVRRLGVRAALAAEGAGGLSDVTVLPFDITEPSGAQLDTPIVNEKRSVAVFHTSGTTGLPKAALMSHEAIVFTAAMTEGHILAAPSDVDPIGPDDVIQTSVPLYTATGLEHFVLLSLWLGCRLVCEPRFDPEETIATAARERSTIWLTVPAMMLLTADAHPTPQAGLGLRVVWHMGSIASRECIEKTSQMLPGCAILNLYSLTETGAGIVASRASDAVERPGASGRPVPPARIRIRDAQGNAVPAGTVGEVQFESPHMFDGYDENEPATDAAFTEDGWFRSGDGGRLDEDGVLWVTGRLGDVIIRGGLNINPRVIEERIMTFEGVRDAIVVGVPHRVLGHDIVGLVSVDGAVDVEQLQSHCLAALPRNEVPRRILVVDEVPRNDFGKLDRRRARDVALASMSDDRSHARSS